MPLFQKNFQGLTLVVAEKQLPFALKVPNTDTRAAMTEVDEIIRKRQAGLAYNKETDEMDLYCHSVDKGKKGTGSVEWVIQLY